MDRRADLDLLRPSFRGSLAGLVADLARMSIPLRVFETIRSPDRQEALYQVGRDPSAVGYGRTVTRARAYQSAHQFGLGTDMVFVVDGAWTWDEPETGMWDAYKRLARAAGLETLSFERPHVQAAGFNWRALPRGPQDTAGWLGWLSSTVNIA